MSGDITMLQVVEALREVWSDDGIALWLGVGNPEFDSQRPVDVCRTAEGRFRVWHWAAAATGSLQPEQASG